MRWRIYYIGGSTFDSSQGAPFDAPKEGCGVIVAPDPEVGRALIHRWNWYYFKSGIWWGADIFGLLDQFKHFAPEITAVIEGRTGLNSEWNELLARADADPDFPIKSAVRPGERGP